MPSDGAYTTLARLAREICDAPVAVVSLEATRQWLDFREGSEAEVCDPAAARALPRDAALWSATLAASDVCEIPDLQRDEPYLTSPSVLGEPNFRFYAGTRLLDETGRAIGTLCALDIRARRLPERRRHALDTVGTTLLTSIERHGRTALAAREMGTLGAALEFVADPIAVARREGAAAPTFLYVNAAFTDLFGYLPAEVIGNSPTMLSGPETAEAADEFTGERRAFYAKSGERRIVNLSDRALNATHRILSFRDVTREHDAEAAITATNVRLQTLLDANNDAVFTLDRSGACRDANAAAQALVGYERAELLGEGLRRAAEGGVFPHGERFPTSLDDGRSLAFPAAYRHRDGRPIAVECNVVPMVVRGKTEGAFVLATDVSERLRLAAVAERQATRAHDLCLVAAATESSDGDRIDAALGVAAASFDMSDAYVAEVRGTTLLVTNRVGETVFDVGDAVEISQTGVGEMLADGDVLALEDNAGHGCICAPLHVNGSVHGVVGFLSRAVRSFDEADRDFMRLTATLISAALERRLRQLELDRLAYLDGLTNIPNRANFVRDLASALAAQLPFALHFIDLDDFKLLNDHAGHGIGDLALVEVGRRLAELCGERERPARLGGDEFAVVQRSEAELPSSIAFGNRIVELLRAPYVLDGRTFELGASVGVALFPRDGGNAEELMRHADTALYGAKAAGKSRVESSELPQGGDYSPDARPV